MAKFRRRGPRHRYIQVVWTLLAFIIALVFADANLDETGFREFYFTIEPSDTVVLKDQPALLECSAKGDDDTEPETEWKREGLFLDYTDNRRNKLANGSLYFSSVHHTRTERPDEGVYQCLATIKSLGTIVSRAVKLQVASLPRFDEQPQDVTVFPEKIARFSCAVQAIPPASITWLKDDKTLAIDESRMIVMPSGALEIDHVEVGDKGVYRCNASNLEKFRLSDAGTLTINMNTAQLNKISAPQFIATPKSVIAIEGSSLTFECAANGNPQPRITWLKDGATIDMAFLDSRFSVVGTGSLQIEHVQETDEGVYMCRAENYEDSVDSSANLEVQVVPRFVKQPTNRYAHEKDDVELDCQIYGKPEPTVQWIKNGNLILEDEFFQFVNGNNLKILGVVTSDVGIYQCIGVNPAGNIQASSQLLVLKPDVVFPTTSLTTPNMAATLDGFPESKDGPDAPQGLNALIVSTRFVTLSWKKPENENGKIIAYSIYYRPENSQRERVVNTTRSRMEEVNIQGLRPSTKYYFRVIAYNEFGSGQSSGELEVETQSEVRVPDAPLNLRALVTSATTILVQWDPPNQRSGPIQRYKLYYMEGGTSEEHETQTSETMYELRGLKKFTEYSFWVVAYNENGPGMSTDEIVVRTKSDLPSTTPQNVTLEAASSTSIIVRWEPPPKGSQNGIITGYKIRYKQKGNRRGDTVTTDGNRRLFALIKLERGAEYSVRISAQTVNGSGPATDWMVAETFQNDLNESKVPDKPGSIKVRPNSNSITVSWTPPRNQNIMVRGYTIGWGIGIPDIYTKLLDGKQRFHTIENLQPSSEYVISLRAYNQMGDGHPIYETVKTRIETTPEPLVPLSTPMGLKAVVLSSSAVVLYWTDNSLSSSQVVTDSRYYTVRYTHQHHSNNPRYRFFNSTEPNCMIGDLKPNTEYEFAVKVSKGRRESHWSLSVRNTTHEIAPSSYPRDVTIVASENSPTAVNVNWQPPKQANGQITGCNQSFKGYTISYTADSTRENWVMEEIDGTKLTKTIKGLTPDTQYVFKIQARNRKGFSPPSPLVAFTTPSLSMVIGVGADKQGEDAANTSNQNNESFPTLYLVIGFVCFAIVIVGVGGAIAYKRSSNRILLETKKKGYGKGKGGKTDVKPPDLWIHHDQMELKQMEKSQNSETSTTSPLTRNSQDFDSDEKSRDTLERKGATYIDSVRNDKSSRHHFRPKPIMIPVDTPREPIATANPLPNGALQQHNDPQGAARPVYPRTQYNIPRAHVTIDPCQPGMTTIRSQPATSPYKKTNTLPTTPSSAAPSISSLKSRSAGVPVITPRAPDASYKSGRDDDLAPSYSTEELNAEMANLEGLMKDLNAITASEFEC
uniref:Neogenin n=1 Tax=Strigamia maritima TaxID=126957 RepID=T1J0I1_STRMM